MPPLTGLKIVDLTKVLAGPFCTMLLGDMGAEVIKIEPPVLGDDCRSWPPYANGVSSYFVGVNRSKKSITLDLKDSAGAAALTALMTDADVLIENLRPGSLDRLGFGFDAVQRLNPRLIYCSISGYGLTGPRRAEPGYDVVVQAEAGLMDVTGQPGGTPTRVGIAIADYLAGLFAAQGILLALIERQRSGRGQRVDIALLDSLLAVMTLPVGILLATGQSPVRMGNEHPSLAPYETFAAADGLITVAVGNDRLWTQFCRALDLDRLEQDARFRSNDGRVEHRAALRGRLTPVFASRTSDDLLGVLRAANVPCGRVASIEEALSGAQVAAREMLVTMPHDVLGAVKVLGNPIKLSRTPYELKLPPPLLGEHNEEILGERMMPSRR